MYSANPHIQTVQNMHGKGRCRGSKAELRPPEVDPYFKRKKYHRRWRQHRAITVDTVDTVDNVDTVDTVDNVDMVYTLDMTHNEESFHTRLSCSNVSMGKTG